MLPADQRFGANHRARAHVDLGLEVHHELAVAESAPNLLQRFVQSAHVAVLIGVEQVIAVLAGELGLVHGLVGLAQQLVGVDLVALRVEGDAETGRDLEHEVADRDRLCRRRQQAVEHRQAGGGVGQIEQHRDELVAAHPGQRIAFA